MITKVMEQEIATIEGLAEIARTQLFAVLEGVEAPVVGCLRQRLMDGEILGETYWRDGCVLGTLAFFDGADDPAMEAAHRVSATTYALEEWAEPIRPGDVPDHTAGEYTGSFRAAVLVSWIDQFEAGRVVA